MFRIMSTGGEMRLVKLVLTFLRIAADDGLLRGRTAVELTNS